MISTLPSPTSCRSSSITTASVPGGMASPVSTHTASRPTRRGSGDVGDAPSVVAAATAMPSMAAAW